MRSSARLFPLDGNGLRSVLGLWLVVATFGCGGAQLGSLAAALIRSGAAGAVLVRAVPPRALSDGLELGDEVLLIDGQDPRQLTDPQLRALLRGPVGSRVQLTVLRGERVLHLELRRR